mmetsp:Transcript_124636/g.399185  ORF Transcript_124636/g.399185 Transcript_124636/m.399185 type:complete len:248 (+) Transcript_124636:2389-3132(+)
MRTKRRPSKCKHPCCNMARWKPAQATHTPCSRNPCMTRSCRGYPNRIRSGMWTTRRCAKGSYCQACGKPPRLSAARSRPRRSPSLRSGRGTSPRAPSCRFQRMRLRCTGPSRRPPNGSPRRCRCPCRPVARLGRSPPLSRSCSEAPGGGCLSRSPCCTRTTRKPTTCIRSPCGTAARQAGRASGNRLAALSGTPRRGAASPCRMWCCKATNFRPAMHIHSSPGTSHSRREGSRHSRRRTCPSTRHAA